MTTRIRPARTILAQTVAVAALALAPVAALAQGGPAPGAGPGAERGEGAGMRRGEGQGEMRRGDRDGMKADDRKADRDRGNRDDRNADRNRPDDRGDRDRADRRDGGPDQRGADMRRGDDRGARRGPVKVVTTEQRTRVRDIIRTRNVEVIHNVEFPVRVGVAVPARYAFRPLPPEIINVVPEYEGYDFIDVDGQILILDPDTRDIVAVLD